jgi:ADP-ribose pyrophosphatase YjhB (NUDIX family)
MGDRFLEAVQPLVLSAQSLALRLFRGTTLGVRAIVGDGETVLLVRHTYVPGWHFPGGAVDPGESAVDAVARELLEEASLEAAVSPELLGIHFNVRMARRDHVLVYRVAEWREKRAFTPTREIAEARFFFRDALPDGATKATRARLAELHEGVPRSVFW